jgi:uncharacterized membrane protein YfcA
MACPELVCSDVLNPHFVASMYRCLSCRRGSTVPMPRAGALTGFMVGLTGVGGGALMTPILLLFFGVPPTTAIATDLWFAAITKVVAARIHNGKGQVDWVVVKRLWLGSSRCHGTLVVVLVSLGAKVQKVGWLSHAIGVVVLITAIGLLLALKPAAHRVAASKTGGSSGQKRPALTVAAGALLGLVRCVDQWAQAHWAA